MTMRRVVPTDILEWVRLSHEEIWSSAVVEGSQGTCSHRLGWFRSSVFSSEVLRST